MNLLFTTECFNETVCIFEKEDGKLIVTYPNGSDFAFVTDFGSKGEKLVLTRYINFLRDQLKQNQGFFENYHTSIEAD